MAFAFEGGRSPALTRANIALAVCASWAVAEGAKRVDHVTENRKSTASSMLPGADLAWESNICYRSDVNVSRRFESDSGGVGGRDSFLRLGQVIPNMMGSCQEYSCILCYGRT